MPHGWGGNWAEVGVCPYGRQTGRLTNDFIGQVTTCPYDLRFSDDKRDACPNDEIIDDKRDACPTDWEGIGQTWESALTEEKREGGPALLLNRPGPVPTIEDFA